MLYNSRVSSQIARRIDAGGNARINCEEALRQGEASKMIAGRVRIQTGQGPCMTEHTWLIHEGVIADPTLCQTEAVVLAYLPKQAYSLEDVENAFRADDCEWLRCFDSE